MSLPGFRSNRSFLTSLKHLFITGKRQSTILYLIYGVKYSRISMARIGFGTMKNDSSQR